MEEETVKCANCLREISGNDPVYYLDTEVRPYCSEECLIANLDYEVTTAKEWIEAE